MTSIPRNRYIGILVAIGATFSYGAYPAAAQAVYATGGNVAFTVFIATLARTLGMVLFCFATKRKLFTTRSDLKESITGGFLQAVCVLTLFAGFAYLPGPVAIIIIYTHTLMLLFYLAWRGEIKIDRLIFITTLMALAGIAFVVDIFHNNNVSSLIGIGLCVLSAILTVSRLYVFGELTKRKHPIIVGAETFVFATAFVALSLAFFHPQLPHDHAGYGWMAVACVSQILGAFGMFYGIGLLGSFHYSLFSKLEPIFTAMFSFLLIGQVLNGIQYFGIVLVIASLASYQYLSHRREKVALK